MKLSDFGYDLPPERIAQRPVNPRDHARLLTVDDAFQDLSIKDLPGLLRAGDLLVFNNTRVIPTRLEGRRKTAKVEVTLHKEDAPGTWRAFAKPARKLKPGDVIEFAPNFAAEVTAKGEYGEVTLTFPLSDADFSQALERHGVMPLPPYIKRSTKPDSQDRHDYQTMFAEIPGAVAAPTAGLHFTPDVLAGLSAKGIDHAMLTLHVGAGTFLPVKTDIVEEHQMHGEWGEINNVTANQINQTRSKGGRIIPAGTTALRLLETAAREDGTVQPFMGETSLFITPGYRFKAVDMLFTNFHLPGSTLFMLVCAFAGTDRMKAAYQHAIKNEYRFYSYGDGSLLKKNDAS
jgi:S-adenosylmethionine:tRNA ribosyltransferase-isomerase